MTKDKNTDALWRSPQDMKTGFSLPILILLIVSVCCQSERKTGNEYSLKHRISDYAEILTIAQEDSLLVIMEDLEMKIGAQVAVLSLPSLNGQKMEEFAFKTAEAARLGRRTHNDGVLIVIADYERQMRIEVGTGLETILTDEVAARILREDMAPKFGEGKYCLGLYLAIDKISSLIKSNEEKIGQQP